MPTIFAQFSAWRRSWRQSRRLDRLARLDAAALAGQAAPQPTRVLVLRNDSIGDYLLFRPWLRRLAQEVRARGQHLTLAANTIWAPLAQAWDEDCFDELVSVDFGRFQREPAYRRTTLAGLGAGGYGEVIYPLHVREPAVECCLGGLRAPVRVGSQGEHRRGPWAARLDAAYTRLLPTTTATLFEYDRNREFFEHWRGQPVPDPPALHLPVPPAALAAYRAQLGPRYAVLFAGASARAKRWPPAHFARLAQALHRHLGPGCRLVLAGSPADNALNQEIVAAAGLGSGAAADPLVNLSGRTTLPELAALLAGAALLVSNDTVAAHLATQANTSCLTLLMGENYGKFFPYPPALHQGPSRCLFPPAQEARFARGDFSRPDFTPDLATIGPDVVLAEALALLG